MRAFAHIIAEKRSDFWSARFVNSPADSCGGMDVNDAVSRLIGMYGDADMDLCGLLTLDSRSDDDRVECLVPYLNRLRWPLWQSPN